MCFIYKITNNINNKLYIGQTLQSIEKRWIQHKSEAKTYKKNQPLHNAIRKYGTENFTIEEIDGANSISELNYKEWLLIYKFNSLAPNGYNCKEGGNRPKYSNKTKEKMTNSAKIRSNKKEYKEWFKKNNPSLNAKYVNKRSKNVKENGTYKGKNNPRYINIDIEELKRLYYNKDKYFTHKDISNILDVSLKVVDNRVKEFGFKRKIKKPNLSKTLRKKWKKKQK